MKIKNELADLIDWEQMNHRLADRVPSLEFNQNRFAEFREKVDLSINSRKE